MGSAEAQGCSPRNGYRFIVLALTALCLTSICSNMIAFNVGDVLIRSTINVTIIQDEEDVFPDLIPSFSDLISIFLCHHALYGQGRRVRPLTIKQIWQTLIRTNSTSIRLTDIEQTQRNSILIWAAAIGSILGTFPFNMLYSHYGARFVFLTAGLISIVGTSLIPMASMFGMVPFVVVRFLQVESGVKKMLNPGFRESRSPPISPALAWYWIFTIWDNLLNLT